MPGPLRPGLELDGQGDDDGQGEHTPYGSRAGAEQERSKAGPFLKAARGYHPPPHPISMWIYIFLYVRAG